MTTSIDYATLATTVANNARSNGQVSRLSRGEARFFFGALHACGKRVSGDNKVATWQNYATQRDDEATLLASFGLLDTSKGSAPHGVQLDAARDMARRALSPRTWIIPTVSRVVNNETAAQRAVLKRAGDLAARAKLAVLELGELEGEGCEVEPSVRKERIIVLRSHLADLKREFASLPLPE